jgi:predicted O-methyltransferase YrrM
MSIAKLVDRHLIWPLRKQYHKLHNLFATNSFSVNFHDDLLIRAFGSSQPALSDISDHLPTIFSEIIAASPKLIVELGTRGGESTKTILAAAKHSDATVLSIDINDCSGVEIADDFKSSWHFVQADDVAFEKESFRGWCSSHGFEPEIDVLFIDTSHLYENTRAEIQAWFPHLSPRATIIFHDTNLNRTSRTYNNTILNIGWENQRGVIRTIEELLGKKCNEHEFFVAVNGEWLINHYPNSFGLTVLKRLTR